MDSRTENTWFTNRYSQKRSPRPSSLAWSMGESSLTEHSVAPGTRDRLLDSSSSFELIGIDRDPDALEEARANLAAYSSRVRLVRDDFKNLTSVLERLGVAEVAESFSTLEFPHPNLMKRIGASPTEQEAPSTCEWIRPVEQRPTTW